MKNESQVNHYRTQKDFDIARSVALKAAVELTVGYPDILSEKQNPAETVLSAASKFYNCLIPDQQEEEIQDPEEITTWQERILDECHVLQKKLGLELTDWENDPCPWGEWDNGGAQELLQSLREKGNGKGKLNPNTRSKLKSQIENGKRGKSKGNGNGKNGNGNGRGKEGLEALADQSGYEDRSIYSASVPQGTFPISRAQFGYVVSLHRKLGTDHDPEFLNGMTSDEASVHIDALKSQI